MGGIFISTQNTFYCFIVGIGFMSLQFFSDSNSANFNDFITMINGLLFYIGYVMTILFGVMTAIKTLKK
jgi:hypothetical protein